MTTEIEETEALLQSATFAGVKAVLQRHLDSLKAATAKPEAAAVAAAAPPAPVDQSSESARLHAPPMPDVTPPPRSTSFRHVAVSNTYIPIDSFSWDQGQYNSPTVTVFVDLDDVGMAKDRVSVTFGKHSFDLKVLDLHGKNYRLVNNNLEKNIIPEQSSFAVKKNKVVLKLQKVKGEYSYEHWTALTAKKKREETTEVKEKDPSASIMEMMKNMYEDGDENMKRIIGEAMLKSQRGEKPAPPSMDDI